MENSEPDDKGAAFAKTAKGQAIMQAYSDKHYRQTLDKPLPMLNNRTPRECAANPDLHTDVVLWLKYLENNSGKKICTEI